ncbi:MAG TPA: right-handed parallel beta-helix repeat-containing protein [Phycisphaerae bacterium]|nr:right-handed parallel beta-helix repeat-containing protein [Phycisphaerae bacterium]HNU44862.1 right-handed parallel beta-helix repeat-containing protein [Phycisphaerae bacterium]
MQHNSCTRTLVLVVVLLGVGGATAGGQAVWYVDEDAPAGGSGGSWASPLKHLRDALATAGSGDAIHVAGGTYRPDRSTAYPTGSGLRTDTFALPGGVYVAGGYAGYGATEPDARDILAHPTILSGDLAGNDGPNFQNYAENSYCVVTCAASSAGATLDGVTVRGGYGDLATGANYGAGLRCTTSGLTVVACAFADNKVGGYPSAGGGMYVGSCGPTLIGCTFVRNSAYYGAGLGNLSGTPTVMDCTFEDNRAERSGGGMYNYATPGAPSASLTGCHFNENWAALYGGGMRNWDAGPSLTRCTFYYNVCPQHGAGMTNGGASNPQMTNCTFAGNRVDTLMSLEHCYGGAVSSYDTSHPTFVNCVFNSNSAQTLFPSLSFGGALACGGSSSSMLTNCTFKGNYANVGDAVFAEATSQVRVSSSILWDVDDEIAWADTASVTVYYSDVLGGWSGTGNIQQDPLFDGLRLAPGSPCINTGNPGYVPPAGLTDMDGHARLLCAVVDMGAYEFGIGDYNCDETVDLDDFASWTACMTGPDQGPYAAGCAAFDFEYDQDVDLSDWARFQNICVGG